MGIEAFVLKLDTSDAALFATQFLISKEFDISTQKKIASALDIPTNMERVQQAEKIADRIGGRLRDQKAVQTVLEQFVLRKKDFLSLKTGKVRQFPQCADPRELLTGIGSQQWYGPIIFSEGDTPSARWYIRPVLITHYEAGEGGKLQLFQVRWHCFARVTDDAISLHWRGFSHADSSDEGTRNSQFKYWNYIPGLFKEIEQKTNADIDYVELQKLLLHDLWAEYRENSDYKWLDRRIRAESGGVSLKAHAGAVYEIKAGGLLHLASTIRRSIQIELQTKYSYVLPNETQFDEVVLKTLIREYGTLSYEFSLEKQPKLLFRGHGYFGMKRDSGTIDCFPHLYLHNLSICPDLEQLAFLKDHWIKYTSRPKNDYDNARPLSLFS